MDRDEEKKLTISVKNLKMMLKGLRIVIARIKINVSIKLKNNYNINKY